MVFLTVNILVVSVCLLLAPARSQKCGQDNDTLTIVCKNANNTIEVEDYFTGDLLKCINCNLPVISNETIKGFEGRALDISSSNVQDITSTAFSNLNALRILKLNNNKIRAISPEVFARLKDLLNLDLRNNNLTTIDGTPFKGAQILQLDLSHNQVSDFASLFDGLSVQTLIISYNDIQEIYTGSFESIVFGSVLVEQTGKIYYSSLILSNNHLERLPKLKADGRLNVLDVSYNNISVIEDNAFEELDSLLKFYAARNHISKITNETFNGLKNLIHLDISRNDLEDLPVGVFRKLTALKELILGNNKLKSVKPSSFSGLLSLETLDLSFNQLKEIADANFFLLKNLNTLDVSRNRLQDPDIKSIVHTFKSLQHINFADNFWTCKSLVKLYEFLKIENVDFNPSRYYDVTNLHGIACTPVSDFKMDENQSFEDFVGGLPQGDLLEKFEDAQREEESGSTNREYLRKIYCIVVSILTIFLLYVACVIILKYRRVFNGLRKTPEDKVELL